MTQNYDKCEKCKYFIQHYNIDFNTIYKVCCGHCIKRPDPNKFKLYSGKQPCPYFEQNKGQRTRVKKRRIANLLTELNLNIEFIKLFLNKNSASQPISDSIIEHIDKR